MTKRGAHVSPSRLVQEGFARHQAGELDAAERKYRRALKLDKKNPDALYLLGTLNLQNNKLKQAENALRLALEVQPDRPEALFNLARVYMYTDRLAEAETLLVGALASDPDSLSILGSLGVVRLNRGDFKGATSVLERAVKVDPSSAEAWCDLGMAYSQGDQDESAGEAFDRALQSQPDHARALHNRGHLRLRQKQFADGWPDYESRRLDPQAGFVPRPFEFPTWSGESLEGKTVLVWLEQGLGDQILQASMLPDLVGQARHVVVECEPRLVPLLARSFPTTTVVPTSVPPRPEIDAAKPDLQCAGGSLGQWLRPTAESFPSSPSFLVCDPDKRASLSGTLKQMCGDRRRIGFSWSSARVGLGPQKSTDLEKDWPSIFSAAVEASFISLQYGDTESERAKAEAATGVSIHGDIDVDVTQDIDGLAALIAALDLVITTSNTTAHLAGALGVPAWVMVPRGPSRLWYWFDGDHASPWYSSLSLYWQNTAGDWSAPIQGVAAAAEHWCKQKAT